MKTNVQEKMVNIIVDFWTNDYKNPKYNNGDPMSMVIAKAFLNTNQEIDNNKIVEFKQKLRDAVIKYKPPVLSTDYGPQGLLREVAQDVFKNIDINSFSWKTAMWIDWKKCTIDVRKGYGSDIETIFNGCQE